MNSVNLSFVSLVYNVLIVSILYSLYTRNGMKSALWMAGSFLAQGIGNGLTMALSLVGIDSAPWYALAFAIDLASLPFMVVSLVLGCEKEVPRSLAALIAALFSGTFIALMAVAFLSPDSPLRVVFFSIFSSSMAAVGALVLSRHLQADGAAIGAAAGRRKRIRAIVVLLWMIAAGHALRVLTLPYNEYDPGLDTAPVQTAFILIIVYLFRGMIAMYFIAELYEQIIDERSRALVQAEKLSSIGTIAAGLAHEINNPASYILLNGRMLQDAWGTLGGAIGSFPGLGDLKVGSITLRQFSEIAPGISGDIVKGAERIERIVAELKRYASPASPPRESGSGGMPDPACDVNVAVASAIKFLEPRMQKLSCVPQVHHSPGPLLVHGVQSQLEHIFVNLLENAMLAMEGKGGTVFLRVSRAQNGFGRIEIRDQGGGIPPEDMARLFDPFFTTRRGRGGTGLGLAVVHWVVSDLGGTVKVDSVLGTGSAFTVEIPVAERD